MSSFLLALWSKDYKPSKRKERTDETNNAVVVVKNWSKIMALLYRLGLKSSLFYICISCFCQIIPHVNLASYYSFGAIECVKAFIKSLG